MTRGSRRVLWYGAGVSLGLSGIVALAGVIAGEFDESFWRVVGMFVIALICAWSALAALELIERRRLVALGWAMLTAAPAQAVTLLVANWKEAVSETYANGLVTTVLLLLSGLVVSTLRLILERRAPAVVAVFAAVVASTVALDALALPLIWTDTAPGPAVDALLALVVVTIVGYVVAPIVQRLSRS